MTDRVFVAQYIIRPSVDPFARNTTLSTHTHAHDGFSPIVLLRRPSSPRIPIPRRRRRRTFGRIPGDRVARTRDLWALPGSSERRLTHGRNILSSSLSPPPPPRSFVASPRVLAGKKKFVSFTYVGAREWDKTDGRFSAVNGDRHPSAGPDAFQRPRQWTGVMTVKTNAVPTRPVFEPRKKRVPRDSGPSSPAANAGHRRREHTIISTMQTRTYPKYDNRWKFLFYIENAFLFLFNQRTGKRRD